MKVVLTKDIRNVGKAGQVIDVSDGHAVNFLFPRKLAVAATPQAIKQAELRQKQHEEQKAIDAALLESNIAKLNDQKLTISMKANDKGHLYEAVSTTEIAAATEKAGIAIPEESIVLEKPIKEIGTFEIPVVSSKKKATFTIVVEAE